MMMRSRKTTLGFSLVEMAIVLAITGVLFGGLYRLFSGGNQQAKDTSVAGQQVQLINAVGGYLGTGDGQTWMGGEMGLGHSLPALPLPDKADAPDGGANLNCHTYMSKPTVDTSGTGKLKSFCDALPAGFSTSTVNAYGQFYSVRVQIGTITPPSVVPSTYSFMIATKGGDVIPDADGGGISTQIGNDGGFIYSLAATCTSPTGVPYQACGTYGSWYANLTGATAPVYGFPGFPGGGHVASRSYVSPEFNSGQPWLARKFIPSDPGGTAEPTYNTMTTALLLGGETFFLGKDTTTPVTPGNIAAQGGAINMNVAGTTTGGGTINMDAGPLNMDGGSINMNAAGSTTGGGFINLAQGGVADTNSDGDALDVSVPVGSYLKAPVAGPPAVTGFNAFLNLKTRCTADPSISPPGVTYHSDCQVALFIQGDQNVFGRVQAYDLFAGTFVYNGSDRRLKTDIKPLSNNLDDIMHLQPVSFTFKAGGQKGLGFIAQDIEKIYPQLVAEKSDGMKAVNYDGLIAPLVESLQELKHENDELRQKLQDETQRQYKLEQQLKQLAK